MIQQVDLTKTKILLGTPRPQEPPYRGKLWDALAREFKKMVKEKRNER